MINAVAIQRLLETAILLKLERGTRTDGGQPDTAKRAGTSELTPQHLARGMEAAIPNRRPIQSGILSMLAAVPPDSAAAIAAPLAHAAREANVAPLAYRESLAEAATPRLTEQPLAVAMIIPAPVQYANAELARALAVNGQHAATGIASDTEASMGRIASLAQQTLQHRKVITRALIAGSLVVAAAYAIATVA